MGRKFTVTISMDEYHLERLERLAAGYDVNRSEMVRLLIGNAPPSPNASKFIKAQPKAWPDLQVEMETPNDHNR